MNARIFYRIVVVMSIALALTGLTAAALDATSAMQAAPAVSLPAAAQHNAQTPNVRVIVPPGAIDVDDVFTVTIRIADVLTPLSAFQFDLTYDPAILSFVYAEPGAFLGATGRQVICPLPATGAGAARLACVSTGPARGATGVGELLIVTFRALAEGRSNLNLSAVQLPDDGRPAALIPATAQGARVTVGEPCIELSEVAISGPPTGTTGVAYTFSAVANPLSGTATLPITYTWQADEQQTLIHGNSGLTDTATFTWTAAGTKTVTVTAVNACDSAIATHTIAIAAPPPACPYPLEAASVVGPSSGYTDTRYTFNAVITPANATQPVTYTWTPAPLNGQNAISATYQWAAPGNYVITLTVENCGGRQTVTHTIVISTPQGPEYKIYLPLILKNTSAQAKAAPRAITLSGTAFGLSFLAPSVFYLSQTDRRRPRRRSLRPPWRQLLHSILIAGLLLPLLPTPPAHAAAPISNPQSPIPDPQYALRTTQHDLTLHVSRFTSNGCFWADPDCDRDVDAADLTLAAQHWNCVGAQACYAAIFDRDGDGDIDARDLATLGNEYDVTPPEIAITAPADRSVVGGLTIQVNGTVSDTHAIAAVSVNGVTATVTGSAFQATVPLTAGNQLLTILAADELGAASAAYRFVFADQEGPTIVIHSPKKNQAVYTLRPTIAISYTDYYTGVNTASLQATLSDGAVVTNVTGLLTAGADGASGVFNFDLGEDRVYTLTFTLADALGNATTARSAFYVPNDPASLTPPEVPEDAGWVSGFVYDSSTCDRDLVDCDGLPGAQVTLVRIISQTITHTEQVSGVVVSGPGGYYAFPVDATAHYALRVEKEGYTYGQRLAQVVRQRATPINAIYLTPIDPAVSLCTSTGCTHTSADGQMQVVIPPGAIAAGDTVTVTATEFDRVNFLPSGELPPNTVETYAFNLGGDSDYEFQTPITISLRNSRGYPAGFEIPLGYWNPETLAWEHVGQGRIDATGEWVVMTVTHFSNYDCNASAAQNVVIDGKTYVYRDGKLCEVEPCAGSEVGLGSGILRQTFALPEVNVLGESVGPVLYYDSHRADPSYIIEVAADAIVGRAAAEPYYNISLYIAGEYKGAYWVNIPWLDPNSPLPPRSGPLPPFRYRWDGRDADGNRLPPGVYDWVAEISVPVWIFTCGAEIFGGVPKWSCWRSMTYISSGAYGTIQTNYVSENPFGIGWDLLGQQHLYASESGQISIEDGNEQTEYYFLAQDLLARNPLSTTTSVQGGRTMMAPVGRETSGQGEGATGGQGDRPAPSIAEDVTGGQEGTVTPVLPNPYFLLPTPYSPQTITTSGYITQNTTWTLANSPYILDGHLTVNAGVTLTVEPGVVVKAMDDVQLRVDGTLIAQGTPTQPITFTSVADSGPGQWRGLIFAGSARGQLKYVTVRYGGDYSGSSSASSNVAILNTAQVEIVSSRILSASNATKTDYGLYVYGEQVVISDTLVAGNGDSTGDYGLYAWGNGSVSVVNSAFRDNSGYPIYFWGANLLRRIAGNTFSGNHPNRIWIGYSTLADSITLSNEDGLEAYEIHGDIYVPAGITLTVEPGVTVKATPPVGQYNTKLIVRGYLSAIGTVTQPITFTSLLDSGPGQWGGIVIDGNGAGGHLRHVLVRYAGHPHSWGVGNITIYNTGVGLTKIENCRIFDANGYGVKVERDDIWGPPQSSRAIIDETRFSGIITSTTYPDSSYALYADGTSVVTVTNNLFIGNGQDVCPLYMRPANLPWMRNNLFLGNACNRIVLRGEATLPADAVLEYIPGHSYEMLSNLTVPPSVTLTVEPGVTVLWDGSRLDLNGRLIARGTPERPILFTSKTNTGPGQWQGINAQNAQLDLAYITLRYAGSADFRAALRMTGGRATIRASSIISNTRWGVDLGFSPTAPELSINGSTISGNGWGGVFALWYLVDARYNWWGHPSGPYDASRNPGGQGNQVIGSGVAFAPWLGQPSEGQFILNLTPGDDTFLTYDEATQTFTRHYPDGSRVHFNPDGTHDYTLDASGNKTAYVYTTVHSQTLLSRIEIYPAGDTQPRWTWTFSYQGAGIRYQGLGNRGRGSANSDNQSPTPNPQSLITITDPAGRVTTLTIDEHGNLVSLHQPGQAAPMNFLYDSTHRMTHKQDERGNVTTYVYDAAGRIQTTIQPPRPIYDPLTDSFEMAQEVQQYLPRDSIYPVFNGLPSGSPTAPLTPTIAAGQTLSSYIIMNGYTYTLRLNPQGALTGAVDPLGRETRIERDEHDRITRLVTPEGNCLEYTYDDKGNVTSESRMGPAQCALDPLERDPAQIQTVRSTYEPRFGQLKTETDALGRVITYTYDYELDQGERGLLMRVEYPRVQNEHGLWVTPVETFAYNAWGQVTRSVDPRGIVTCYTYTLGTETNLFAPGVKPVPGLLIQMAEDCGGPLQRVTEWRDFNAIGLPQHIRYPGGENALQVWQAFDARGRMISQTLSTGLTTLYTYDAGDNLIQVIEDPGGQHRVTEYTYDAINQLLSARVSGGGESVQTFYGYDLGRHVTLYQDGRGNRTRYVYNAAGMLTHIIDALGNETTYTYNNELRVETITNPRGVVTRFVYDEFGRRIRQIQDAGRLNLTTSITYTLNDLPAIVTDPAGRRTCLAYDALDRLTARIADCGGLAATTRYAYDLNDNPVVITDALGYATRLGYDRLDRLTTITDALGGVARYTYDAADNLVLEVDELGQATRYAYDALGNTLVITDALMHTTRYAYDLWNNVTAMTDPLGAVTTYAYDGLGRRARVVNPLGGVTQYAYDANGNITAITDPLGRTRRYEYDALDRMTRSIDPAGYASTFTYDAGGNLIAEGDSLGRIARVGYDALDRPIIFTDTMGYPAYLVYDAVGNLLASTDANGQTIRYGYDSLDRRIVITDANGAVTRMTYDLIGNLLSVTDPLNNVTRYAYDALGRVVTETSPLSSTRTYAYDAVGNMTRYTDRNGRTRTFAYDALNRLTAETWVGAGRTLQFGYDAADNMISARDADSVYAMTYDAMGSLKTFNTAGTPGMPPVMLEYEYDLYGNTRFVREYVNGQAAGVTEYTYDARNLITRIMQSGAGVAPKRVDLTYDAGRRLTGIVRYRDLNGAQPVGSSALSYNARSKLTGALHLPATGAPIAYAWGYDPASRLITATTPAGNAQFTYDNIVQLLNADYTAQPDETYTYDANGNRTGAGYVVGADNRLLADGVYSYTYDAEGNLTRRIEIATGAVTEYTWDYRNRLTGLTFKNSGGAVTQIITNVYDVNNLRIAHMVDADGAGPGAAQVERFVNDGANVALILNGAGQVTHRYLRGGKPDMILAEESATGVRWPLLDQNGVIADVLDNSGALVNHITYDSFGRILNQSDPAHSLRFAYVGREWDAAAGLYYYRSRYYDPRQGRFISQDTVGFSSSDVNLYRYVFNSPLNYTDPEGYVYGEQSWWDRAVNWTLNAIPINREADQFVSGVANEVSFGLTDYVREQAYGDFATANHQGGWRTAGELVGTGISLALPGGNVVKGAKVAKTARGLNILKAVQKGGQAVQYVEMLIEFGEKIKQDCPPASFTDILPLLRLGSFGRATKMAGISNLFGKQKLDPLQLLRKMRLERGYYGKNAEFLKEIKAMKKTKTAAREAERRARIAQVTEFLKDPKKTMRMTGQQREAFLHPPKPKPVDPLDAALQQVGLTREEYRNIQNRIHQRKVNQMIQDVNQKFAAPRQDDWRKFFEGGGTAKIFFQRP